MTNALTGTPTNKVTSRVVMELAQEIVKQKRPTPTQSSNFYAIVSRAYYETTHIEKNVYILSTSTLEKVLANLVLEDEAYGREIKQPRGEEYWDSIEKPFSPGASSGVRYVIGNDFAHGVQAPPRYGSEEYLSALAEVKRISQLRNADQIAAINFWGGVPGTVSPAGIWQNRLYEITKKYNLTDKEYSYAQMVLAESVADAFMECWGVKYTYWTKRPDMVDKSIETAMPNPPFPSYVSGHSTVSFTAATVLARLFPGDAHVFFDDAEEAMNSRLWAGIHFPFDNMAGKKLGMEVGSAVILKLDLQSMR